MTRPMDKRSGRNWTNYMSELKYVFPFLQAGMNDIVGSHA